MKSLTLLFLCVLAVGLAGCNSKGKNALNNEAAAAWLCANAGSADSSIQGAWSGTDARWGAVHFQQIESKIRGTMGRHQVDGHMKGSVAYLTLRSDGRVHYTIVAKKRGSILSGFYSKSAPFSSLDQQSLELKRNE
jgi:hypothetical protein